MRKIIIYLMGAILLGACAKPQHDAHKISIEINAENEIKVEGEIIPAEDLHNVLTRRIAEIEAENIQRDSIVTSIRIDRQAQMGTVTDVIQTMQELRLSKIEYTGTHPQAQGFRSRYHPDNSSWTLRMLSLQPLAESKAVQMREYLLYFDDHEL